MHKELLEAVYELLENAGNVKWEENPIVVRKADLDRLEEIADRITVSQLTPAEIAILNNARYS